MTAFPLNCWSESDQKAVREQLVRILHSGPFVQSRRRQRFLEYIISETLAGRGEQLKGYNVGLEVFDRPETFDPVVDPIVHAPLPPDPDWPRRWLTPSSAPYPSQPVL